MGALRLTYHNSNLIASSSLELANHLGNVLSVISDKPIPHPSGSTVAYYKADILQSQDYSPFGVTLRGRNLKRSGLTEDFRFGYQGSEADDEMKGEGNSYTTFYRMLDPRLGRWFSTDPVFQPHQSPYNSMDNKPILLNDKKGDYTKHQAKKQAKAANKAGFQTHISQNDVGGKREYIVNVTKENSVHVFGQEQKSVFSAKFVKGDITPGSLKENVTRDLYVNGQLYCPGYEVTYGSDLKDKAEKAAVALKKMQLDQLTANITNIEKGSMYFLAAVVALPAAVELAPMYGQTLANGGGVSMVKEVVNQSVTQYVQNGEISIAKYDLLSVFTSSLLKTGSPLRNELIQGASGGVLTYTLEKGFESPLQQSTEYGVITMLLGGIGPLIGVSPVITRKGAPILTEVLTGAGQGAIESAKDQQEK